jgi:hypothetical protein
VAKLASSSREHLRVFLHYRQIVGDEAARSERVSYMAAIWENTTITVILVILFVNSWIIVARLDRLGRQLEAVCADIKQELAQDPSRKKEIIRDWTESKEQQTKEARRFWIFWAIVGAIALGWILFSAAR